MQVRPSHDVLRLRAFIRSARDVPVMCEDHNLWGSLFTRASHRAQAHPQILYVHLPSLWIMPSLNQHRIVVNCRMKRMTDVEREVYN